MAMRINRNVSRAVTGDCLRHDSPDNNKGYSVKVKTSVVGLLARALWTADLTVKEGGSHACHSVFAAVPAEAWWQLAKHASQDLQKPVGSADSGATSGACADSPLSTTAVCVSLLACPRSLL